MHRLILRMRRGAAFGALILLADANLAQAQTVAPAELGTIDVIGVAPAQGAELPESLLPYNVQSAGSADFERAQVLDATDYLNRRAAGVSISAVQGNPLQPDLQFRGFSATPLLGGSEGVSVYVDGVRVNEVFGDTVNWDLIPEEAMAKLSLLSGANPLFGLNTLGGAIRIQTKNGFTDPGLHAEIYGGSFGRSETTIADGGNDGTWGWYALGNHFEERGWRDLSNSNVGMFLGTASWRGDQASLDLHLTHAQSKLGGNGAQSVELLALAPDSIFTAPDRTQNFHSGVTAQGTWQLNRETSLAATLFVRQVNTRVYNGDVSDLAACTPDASLRCNDDGTPALDQNGNGIPTAFDAINNIGVRKQRSAGASLQAIFKQPLLGRDNQFVSGMDIDDGRVNYNAFTAASYLSPLAADRFSQHTAANTGVLLPDQALAVHSADNNAGVYVTDTWSITERLALTASARYNRTRIDVTDRSGRDPDLDGRHAFERLNPAFGATYQLEKSVNVYAGLSASTRAPTPVELTCASPTAPCKLPNDFAADPDLRQVVARSVEAGVRGTLAPGDDALLHWQSGVFRTTNAHDVLFQATGGAQSNDGFFANVGDTRRQGVEFALNGRFFDARLYAYANYTLLDATFRTPFIEHSANHPMANGDGMIAVARGERIPGIPRSALKLGADYQLTRAFDLGCDVVYNSARWLRGDEANELRPLGGYALLNVRGNWHFGGHLTLFARVENVFNRRYASFGTLGDARALYPQIGDARFVTAGAPRAGWIGFSAGL